MSILILCIIYAAFISLGLPDGMLGAAWPTIRGQFGLPLGYAGFVSLTISAGTIVSSLLSVKVLRRFGTGKVSAVSVLLTAVGLLGFSLAPSFGWLFLFAIPLGIGGGAIDSGLNEYVAEHYKASHMNFLHSFWGIGALTGPLVMSAFIRQNGVWQNGYRFTAAVQFVLVIVMFCALPVWKRAERKSRLEHEALLARAERENITHPAKKTFIESIRVPGVKEVLLCFMTYASMEFMLGLWGSSYLTAVKGFETARAAAWVSLYYGGITAGRFLCGFLAMKLSNKTLIRTGALTALTGVACLFAGHYTGVGDWCTLCGFIFFGLGCAPIFPAMLHETPARFGKDNAQAVMGFQMAVAYTSSALMPPLFGWVATIASVSILPWVLAGFALVLFICSEKANGIFKK
ncbi:MFS transporter [Treponema brennaborense]|uniref:Major facilitator superfamily MFS_1 n=1 Tax=Treponema brennaborense (strain DSM 12168 / CIP 105900 / DD5/3) TaxID=906968 RepID=F4LNC9_TREBD|nr:MFS transporter [Treponema brennaborense]AEE17887.1 major facilitator superfamily MFS_1 [Treponema brennaborense DSM 12168]